MSAAERVQPALIIVMFSLTTFIQKEKKEKNKKKEKKKKKKKKEKKGKKEKKDHGKSWNIMDHHEIEN